MVAHVMGGDPYSALVVLEEEVLRHYPGGAPETYLDLLNAAPAELGEWLLQRAAVWADMDTEPDDV